MKKKEERKEKVLELYNSGMKIAEIVENLDVSIVTVTNYIKELKEEGKTEGRKSKLKKQKNKEKTLELYDDGIKIAEIAEILDASVSTVSRCIKELKKEGRIKGKKTDLKKEENKEKILELYNEGIKIVEIAESLGVSAVTVSNYIKELREEGKIQKRKNPKKEENKDKTLELYNEGIKIVEIAESLGVSATTVRNYIKELREEGKIQERKNIKKEENKEKTLKLYNLEMQGKEIAESLGVSDTTVSNYIKELREEGRIQKRKNPKRKNSKKEENKEKVLKLYNLEMQGKEIAESLGVSATIVSRYIKELREEGRIQKRKNPKRKNSKKEENKEKTLKLYNLEMQGKEIAESLEISAATVSNYIKELREEGRIQKRKNPKKEENKEKTLELYNEGIKIVKIAESLGVSAATVSRYIKELEKEGKIQKRKNINKEENKEKSKEKILELYNLGLQYEEITEILGVSITTVNQYIKELKEEGKIQKRKNPKRKNSNKEENKEKILELYNEGIKIVEIAESLGVSTTTVNKYIKELKEEGKIQKRKNKKNISMNVQKIVNKETLSKNDYKKVFEYFLNCQERLSNGDLKKEDLITIKKVAFRTYKYDHIVFYIKACIHLGQITEAKKVVNSLRFSKDFSAEQKEKLNELSKKIVEISKKRTAVIMLKEGKSIKEIAEYSGMRETEVAHLKRKLLAKNRKVQHGDAIGDDR